MIPNILSAYDIRNIARIFEVTPDTQVKHADILNMRAWVARSLRAEKLLHPAIADISYVSGQPYSSVPEMKQKAYSSSVLQISTDYNAGTVWGDECNLRFRAWHDLIHIRHEIIDCEFTLDGELCAFNGHLPYCDNMYKVVWLFSEIVAQVCFLRTYGEFPEQKLVLSLAFMPHIRRIASAYGQELPQG